MKKAAVVTLSSLYMGYKLSNCNLKKTNTWK